MKPIIFRWVKTSDTHFATLVETKHLPIPGGRGFEMDIERRPLQYNVLIDIGILLTLVVLLGVADLWHTPKRCVPRWSGGHTRAM